MRHASAWTLAVVFLFLGLLLPAVNVAFEAESDRTSVENETVPVDYASVVDTDAPAYAFDYSTGQNTSVYYNGSELQNGSDYRWYPANGSIKWFNTTATEANTTGNASYSYSTRSEATRGVASIFATLAHLAGGIILLVCVGAAYFYVGGDW
jgi:hypothetical protein